MYILYLYTQRAGRCAYVAGIPRVNISIVFVAPPPSRRYITNSHIMSAHKTLSEMERQRQRQRWSTNIYVIILYISFYIFLSFFFFLFASRLFITILSRCRSNRCPLHARTWKNCTSQRHNIMDIFILLRDGAIRLLYHNVYNIHNIITYIPFSEILFIGDVIVKEHIITISGRPRWV